MFGSGATNGIPPGTRACTAPNAAAGGGATLTAVELPIAATTPRATATSTWASGLFCPQVSRRDGRPHGLVAYRSVLAPRDGSRPITGYAAAQRPATRDDEDALTARIVKLASCYGRYGSCRRTGPDVHAHFLWSAPPFIPSARWSEFSFLLPPVPVPAGRARHL